MFKIINFLTDQEIKTAGSYHELAQWLFSRRYCNPVAAYFLPENPHTDTHLAPVLKIVAV